MHKFLFFLQYFVFLIFGGVLFGQPLIEDKKIEAFETYEKVRELGKTYEELDSIFYYTTKSIQLFTELSMDSMIIISNMDLAYWYDFQGELEKSRAVLSECITILREDTNSFLKIIVDIGLANSFAKGAYYNVDSSLFYAQKAYSNALSLDDCVHQMVAISIQIEACMKNSIYLERIPELFEKAKKLENCTQETQSLMLLLNADFGKYLILKKRFVQAITVFEELLNKVSDDDLKFIKYIKEIMGQSYEVIGNYKVANQIHRDVISLIQEITEKEKAMDIEQVQAAFESEKKENQIIQLQATNALKEKNAKRQSVLLWVISLGLLVIIGLITQALRSTRKRIRSDEQLIAFQSEMSAMKSKLYTNITHEFRTPLTVIIGLTKKLKGNFEEKVLIERNSNQLLSMVNEMLDLSKADAGALSVNNIQANIIVYLEYLLESLLSIASKKQIRMVFHSTEKEVIMDYDAEKIRQICHNLLSNALKFTPSGGKIILLAERIGNELTLKFSDSGDGIPPDDLPHVFDRFYQSSRTDAGGTGIGLALVKELIHLMNGSIHVTSELNIGTEVTLKFPITNNAPLSVSDLPERNVTHINQYHSASLAGRFSNNDKIALVVEDNEDVATYIERCIQKSYKVLLATNGEEGLIKALEVIPDIVLSDVMMPIMNGFKLTKLLKSDERTSHIPIILLTAKVTQEEKLEGLDSGADAYIPKPFDEKELLVRMRKLIELRLNFNEKSNSKENVDYSEDDFVLKVIDLLKSKVSTVNYTVAELVADLNLSRMQVHRKLKAITGMTTTEFVNNYKLERAHDLIQKESSTIAEVSYEVGFTSPSYFSLLFKEKYGYEPSKLRE